MAKAWENSLPRIEKTLKTLNLPLNGRYLFGDEISLADLKFLWLKILLTDPFFNKEKVSSKSHKQFFVESRLRIRNKPNKYAAVSKVLQDSAPTALQIANKAASHPSVSDYLAKDGHLPATGIAKF